MIKANQLSRLRLTLISLLSLISVIFLSACTIDTTDNRGGYFDFSESKNGSNPSEQAIASTAGSIHASISQLEKIERYRKPRIINVADDNMKKYHLGQKVQVDWSGPIEPLISEVAAFSDYRFKVVGIAPAIPVLVDISHQNVAIGDIIREAHFQSKERANLVVYPKSKTIELRYNEIG